MSSKVITFGKYSGETVLNVAIADPSYAAWAAQNLKSADWRKAFADALFQSSPDPEAGCNE